jgi:hypothetical protein
MCVTRTNSVLKRETLQRTEQCMEVPAKLTLAQQMQERSAARKRELEEKKQEAERKRLEILEAKRRAEEERAAALAEEKRKREEEKKQRLSAFGEKESKPTIAQQMQERAAARKREYEAKKLEADRKRPEAKQRAEDAKEQENEQSEQSEVQRENEDFIPAGFCSDAQSEAQSESEDRNVQSESEEFVGEVQGEAKLTIAQQMQERAAARRRELEAKKQEAERKRIETIEARKRADEERRLAVLGERDARMAEAKKKREEEKQKREEEMRARREEMERRWAEEKAQKQLEAEQRKMQEEQRRLRAAEEERLRELMLASGLAGSLIGNGEDSTGEMLCALEAHNAQRNAEKQRIKHQRQRQHQERIQMAKQEKLSKISQREAEKQRAHNEKTAAKQARRNAWIGAKQDYAAAEAARKIALHEAFLEREKRRQAKAELGLLEGKNVDLDEYKMFMGGVSFDDLRKFRVLSHGKVSDSDYNKMKQERIKALCRIADSYGTVRKRIPCWDKGHCFFVYQSKESLDRALESLKNFEMRQSHYEAWCSTFTKEGKNGALIAPKRDSYYVRVPKKITKAQRAQAQRAQAQAQEPTSKAYAVQELDYSHYTN